MALSQDRFAEIANQVNQIPIEKVVFAETPYVKSEGPHQLGLCPFHNDHSAGSFKVTPSRNLWKCWGCGDGFGGKGGVSFYAKLYKLNYPDAVMALAQKHHLVTDAELTDYYANKEHKEYSRELVFKPEARIVNEKLDPDQLNTVYEALIKASPAMSEKEKAELKKNRVLTDKELQQFFIFPSNGKLFWQKFLGLLKEEGIDPLVALTHTPGFYRKKETGIFSFANEGGNLGIIEHDPQGRINGIQIRRADDCDKSRRYAFFSSQFADHGAGNVIDGTGIGETVDAIPGRKKKYLACTEGKFKALKIQSTFGIYSLNMHGISSWPANLVAQLAAEKEKSTILLFYDADIQTNDAVAKAAIRFANAMMTKGLQVEFVLWNPDLGKGIDDMLNAGHAKELFREDARTTITTRLQPFIAAQRKLRNK